MKMSVLINILIILDKLIEDYYYYTVVNFTDKVIFKINYEPFRHLD